MLEALARRGFDVQAVCGSTFDFDRDFDLRTWLAGRGLIFEPDCENWVVDGRGVRADRPILGLSAGGIPITICLGASRRRGCITHDECTAFLHQIDASLSRFQPEIVVSFGDLVRSVLAPQSHPRPCRNIRLL
jgi:hypothetical protein